MFTGPWEKPSLPDRLDVSIGSKHWTKFCTEGWPCLKMPINSSDGKSKTNSEMLLDGN